MFKNIIEKYHKIYIDRVLPKKKVTENTPESCEGTVRLLDDFADLRKAANEAIFLNKSNKNENDDNY